MQSRAIVFTSANQVELQTIEMPAPAPEQVQIRTHFSSISAGTEGWALQDQFTWSKTPFPCVPGYQRTGTILAIGDGVSGWKVGDRVAATRGWWESPVKPFWGAHAQIANSPANELYQLPPGIDEIDAAAGVIAQVGYNAAYRPTLNAGDWVVVYGDGIIGQCAAQAARSRGAKVILVGHRAERLKLGAQHSADVVINNTDQSVEQAVKEQTKGAPIVAVLDTVQTVASQREYLPLLQHGIGQVVYSGFTPGTCWADMAYLQQREITTHFVSGWNRARMEATLARMAAGKMRVRPLVTHLVPASQGPEMYKMIREKSQAFMAIVLDWSEFA